MTSQPTRWRGTCHGCTFSTTKVHVRKRQRTSFRAEVWCTNCNSYQVYLYERENA